MIIKTVKNKISRFTASFGLKTKVAVKRYIKKFINAVFTTIILLALTVIAFYILLEGCKMIWSIYQFTTVGKHYLRINPEMSSLIAGVLQGNMFHFSVYYVLLTFFSCLGICTLLQMFCIARFFYQPMGMLRRILFFGFPLAYTIGSIDSQSLDPILINQSFVITLFPTLMLFHNCFQNTTLFIPEILSVFSFIKKHFLYQGEEY